MKVIFVSGPFRAPDSWIRENNIRRAEEVAIELWRMGAAVICPHTNTRYFDGAADDAIWLEGDLAMLQRCDALVLIPGWRQSMGARDERARAYSLKIPMFEWPQDQEAIRAWIGSKTT